MREVRGREGGPDWRCAARRSARGRNRLRASPGQVLSHQVLRRGVVRQGAFALFCWLCGGGVDVICDVMCDVM
eukprot:2814472-Rhodomonas_salina.1